MSVAVRDKSQVVASSIFLLNLVKETKIHSFIQEGSVLSFQDKPRDSEMNKPQSMLQEVPVMCMWLAGYPRKDNHTAL